MTQYEKTLALWRSYDMQSEGDLDKYLENFRILFAYHSGRIENAQITLHDTREIFENGKVLSFTGEPKAIFEQQNQRLCYEYLKSKILVKAPLTLSLIREVHAILTGGTYDEKRYVLQGERPGEFKKHDYVTGREEVGSPPESVAQDLQALLGELTEYQGKDPLKLAAYFHARFEYIHPFADGNGRVGRTLLNYFLMTNGCPPLIIYDEDKAAYYAALESYDREGALEPMHAFLQGQMEKTWEKAVARRG